MVQVIDSIKPTTGYYFSASMRTENAKQSHIVLFLWDSKASIRTATLYPQTPIDGTRDWWNVTLYVQTPANTNEIQIYLVGGYSLDGKMPGDTWFTSLSLQEAYVPVNYSTLADQYTKYLSSFAFSLPDPSNQSSFVLQSPDLPSSQLRAFENISKAILLPGNLDPRSIGSLRISKAIIYAFDAESTLRPTTGYWSHSVDPFIGQSRPVVVSQGGSGSVQLIALYDGFYNVAIDLQTTGPFQVGIENMTLGLTTIGSSGGSDWYETPSLYLLHGVYRINLGFNGQRTTINQIIVFFHNTTSEDSFATMLNGHASVVTTARIGVEGFRATIESSSPFLVVFGESYDPRWVATVRNSTTDHVLAMGWANGFFVKSTGQTTLEIVYAGQQPWEIELIIAGATWLLLLFAVCLEFLKMRKRSNLSPKQKGHESPDVYQKSF
jgi:hypothetical protein